MNKLLDLTGKLTVITGGGTGIGFAIASVFAENGSNVVITGRRINVLVDAVKSLGNKASYVASDITQLGEIPSLIDSIESSHGPIDILVNNAGIHIKKDVFDYTDTDFQQIILTNQSAVFAISREVARKMTLRKKGCILMISSMASQYGLPRVIGYTASKSAVEGMTRGLAVELSPLGIRVNCIAPGFIQTSMSAGALDSD